MVPGGETPRVDRGVLQLLRQDVDKVATDGERVEDFIVAGERLAELDGTVCVRHEGHRQDVERDARRVVDA